MTISGTDLTIGETDSLLADFRWLKYPPAPLLPPRNPEVWGQCVEEAWQAQEKHVRKRALAAFIGGGHPGRCLDNFERRNAVRKVLESQTGEPSCAGLSSRFHTRPERSYPRYDAEYAKAEVAARRAIGGAAAAVRKRLDLLLVSVKMSLLGWSELAADSGVARAWRTYQAAVQHDAEAYRKRLTDPARARHPASAERQPPAIDTVIQDLERIKAKLQRAADRQPAEIAPGKNAEQKKKAKGEHREGKRVPRAISIDDLKCEMENHLKDAKDHAFALKETGKAPELLPRPTMKALASMIGVSPSTVTRCFQDDVYVRMLWRNLNDLDFVMKWSKK